MNMKDIVTFTHVEQLGIYYYYVHFVFPPKPIDNCIPFKKKDGWKSNKLVCSSQRKLISTVWIRIHAKISVCLRLF